MLRKLLKGAGLLVVVLVVLLVVGYVAAYVVSEGMISKTYATPSIGLMAPTDAAAIERGKHITGAIADCQACHGANFAGRVIFNDPPIGRVSAPNLTRGKNGFGSVLSDADLARVLRYGVLPNGKSVRVMPSEEFQYLSDADLGAVIAFLKTLPPADSDLPTTEVGPLGRVLMAVGQLPIFKAEQVDFHMPRPATVVPAVNVDYGKYLANVSGCTTCHGPGLSGGQIPGSPPGRRAGGESHAERRGRQMVGGGLHQHDSHGQRPHGSPAGG